MVPCRPRFLCRLTALIILLSPFNGLGTMVLYGPWENTAYPMFMHWSVSLGWLWNCNAVNQKASFLCTLYIYIYLYIVTVWYLAKCMTRRHFFPLNIFIFILHANRFYLYRWCMFKKNHDPPPLLDQSEKQWPLLYQFPIFSQPIS